MLFFLLNKRYKCFVVILSLSISPTLVCKCLAMSIVSHPLKHLTMLRVFLWVGIIELAVEICCGMFDVNNHIIQRHASTTGRHCFMGDDGRPYGIAQSNDSTLRNFLSIPESLAMLRSNLNILELSPSNSK